MSFKLGAFNTTSIAGFKAILTEWPMLPSEINLEELPAGDGSLYYRSRMTESEWVFNLELTGSSIASVLAKADLVSKALNPKLLGLQSFTPNAMDPWVWKGVLSGTVSWERDSVLWFSDQGVCRLVGKATIVTPNPYGYSAVAPVVLLAPGTLALAGGGNTSYFPTVEFTGVLSSTQKFSLGGMTVSGPLLVTETLVLDFGGMNFYIKNTATGVKVRNVADRILNFRRFETVGAFNEAVSVTAGTFTKATGTVLSRRI